MKISATLSGSSPAAFWANSPTGAPWASMPTASIVASAPRPLVISRIVSEISSWSRG